MALNKLEKVSLRDRILDSIRNAIIEGKFKAGEKIPEQDLAAQLGVSRTPIREAIRVLEQQGLLEIRPQNGTYVARLNKQESMDGLYVRAALEELAVRQALERLTIDEWDDLCAEYQALLADGHYAVAQNDPVAGIEFDTRWHELLVDSARNRTLSRTWHMTGAANLIWSFEFDLYPVDKQAYMNWVLRHQELLDAFRGRDPDTCAAAIRYHILRKVSDIDPGG
ncbi:MAG: GntR family transcriptional regulator [Chloroflexi bacterium]|nr:GntR family transcriptional regulator [Chloroflexota bacterium]